MATFYKIEMVGEYTLMPEWVRNLPISEEASKGLQDGYLAFELRGSYNRIQELLETLVKIRLELPVDVVNLLMADRFCQDEVYRPYDRLMDYVGIFEEVESMYIQRRGEC